MKLLRKETFSVGSRVMVFEETEGFETERIYFIRKLSGSKALISNALMKNGEYTFFKEIEIRRLTLC